MTYVVSKMVKSHFFQLIIYMLYNYREKKRERGNELFGRKDFSGAINSYSK